MRLAFTLGSLLTLVVFAPSVQAHSLGIECKSRGDAIDVESFYDDDTPCRNAKIHVERTDKSIVAQGQTDDHGRWSFDRPTPGKYVVVVNDGNGHLAKNAITVTADDIAAPSPGKKSPLGMGPTRQEFTQIPWQQLGIGVVAIAAGAFALHLILRRGRTHPTEPSK